MLVFVVIYSNPWTYLEGFANLSNPTRIVKLKLQRSFYVCPFAPALWWVVEKYAIVNIKRRCNLRKKLIYYVIQSFKSCTTILTVWISAIGFHSVIFFNWHFRQTCKRVIVKFPLLCESVYVEWRFMVGACHHFFLSEIHTVSCILVHVFLEVR